MVLATSTNLSLLIFDSVVDNNFKLFVVVGVGPDSTTYMKSTFQI